MDGSIPMGDIIGGIHASTPMDFLHGFCAGLYKTVLAASLAILVKIGGNQFYDLFNIIETTMQTMKTFPAISGFSGTVFKHGKLHAVMTLV